jgi:succinoglycan biosynthesis transport protein ExoP
MDALTDEVATARASPSDLEMLAAFGRRNWWLVAACGALGLLGGLVYVALAPRSYEASAVLIIQPRSSDPSSQQSPPATPELVRSQVEVLQSRSVLDPAVRQLALYHDPEFDGAAGAPPTARRIAAAEQALSDRLTVDNDGRSYAINLTVRSHDPEKAARIANAIASLYVEQERAQKINQIESTQRSLGTRLADLREQTLASENAAESFRRASGLVPLSSIPEDSESYSAATPASREIIELAKENADLAGKAAEGRARLMSQQRAIASGHGDSTVEVLASPVIANLRQQEADVAKQKAELLAKYRPDHPLIRPIEDKLAQIRSEISAETARVHSSVASNAGASTEAFGTADRYMDALTSRRSGELSASTRLSQLQDDAKLKRKVYEEFAAQMQRATEQASVQLPDVNLASPASAPIRPSAPKKGPVLLVAVAAGLLLGILLGLARSLIARPGTLVEVRRTRASAA